MKKTMARFNGFDKKFFDFFVELKENNNRDWFTANKTRYREQVVTPMSHFIEAMAPRLGKLSKHFNADPRPHGGSMFRIYRDIRFSKDKRPYKEHAAVHFRHHQARDAHAPGFYLHLAPDEVIIAGGVWLPPKEALLAIRTRIAEQPGAWTRVIHDQALVRTFGGISGDGLKRPPKSFDANHKHIEDIKRKTFFVVHHGKRAQARRAGFVDTVADIFADAAPLMRFLCRAVGARY